MDNKNGNLVMSVNDILHSEVGSFRSYRVLDLLGVGTFGQVVKCEDCETKKHVAIKVIKNKPAYFNQGLVEMRILTMLNEQYDVDDKKHMVHLQGHFCYKGHLCLVFELLSNNLYDLIKQNGFRGLSCDVVCSFVTQLLEAMVVLRRARVIHCDLKPENILLQKAGSSEIKLIDFGSACLEFQTVYSYVQSRFYRAPEVSITNDCISKNFYPLLFSVPHVSALLDTLGPPWHQLLFQRRCLESRVHCCGTIPW